MKWCLIHIGIFLLMIVKTINGQDLVQIVWGGNCPEAWKDDQRFEQISSDSMENYLFESGFPFAKVTERSEEHTSELQSRGHLVCRLLLEKKKNTSTNTGVIYT